MKIVEHRLYYINHKLHLKIGRQFTKQLNLSLSQAICYKKMIETCITNTGAKLKTKIIDPFLRKIQNGLPMQCWNCQFIIVIIWKYQSSWVCIKCEPCEAPKTCRITHEYSSEPCIFRRNVSIRSNIFVRVCYIVYNLKLICDAENNVFCLVKVRNKCWR